MATLSEALDVPASQKIEVLATRFNDAFARKAEACTPELHEWIDLPLSVSSVRHGYPITQPRTRAPRGLVWVGYFSEPNHNHALTSEPHPHPQPPWLWMWLLRKTLYLDNQGSDWLDPRLI
jgi:hypothetical protein